MSDNPYLKPPLPVQIGPYVATLRIHHDERGVAWIDNSNIKVIEVILDHLQGMTPQEMVEEYPHLSLVQIYTAIAYYYDHQQEVDALIRDWEESYERGRAASNQPTRAELEARLKERAVKVA